MKQEENEKVVRVGSTVTVKSENETMQLLLCGTKTEKRYIQMGGAYGDCLTEETRIGEHIGYPLSDNVVSVVSPLGGALLNSKVGDYVKCKGEKFLIIDIEE